MKIYVNLLDSIKFYVVREDKFDVLYYKIVCRGGERPSVEGEILKICIEGNLKEFGKIFFNSNLIKGIEINGYDITMKLFIDSKYYNAKRLDKVDFTMNYNIDESILFIE